MASNEGVLAKHCRSDQKAGSVWPALFALNSRYFVKRTMDLFKQDQKSCLAVNEPTSRHHIYL